MAVEWGMDVLFVVEIVLWAGLGLGTVIAGCVDSSALVVWA